MAVKLARPHAVDPVFVGRRASGHKIELRIGESRRGESRIAMLNAREAQKIALALLSEAEDDLSERAKSN
jgi:hypothetical protein